MFKRKLKNKILMASFIFCLCFVLLLTSTVSPVAYSVSNQSISWGFSKSKNHQPPHVGGYESILEKYDSVYIGDTSKKEIYLTFDNGYENGYTAQVLDVLKAKQVPATFFITGHYITDQPELVIRMTEEGHLVGNHSWHHPDLTKVSDQKLKDELEKVRAAYEDLTGIKHMNYLRPPRGIFSERTLDLALQEGYLHIFWSLAFKDWDIKQQKGWQYAYDNIMKQIHPGAILLLHTVSKDNADALAKVIDDLHAEGYVFKSLDDLYFNRMIPLP